MDVLYVIFDDVIAGLMATMDAWIANPYAGGLALVIIILSALFMSELGQVVSTAFTALFVWGLGLVALGAYNSEPQWDFVGQLDSAWAAIASLSFFQFFIYLLIFTVLIGLVNLVKGLISG